MSKRGHRLDELGWKAPFGVYGSYLAMAIIVLSMLAQIVAGALPPVIASDMTNIENLFMGVLGFIAVAVLFLGHLLYATFWGGKTWRQRLLIPLGDIPVPELEIPVPSTGNSVDAEKGDGDLLRA